ncbi:Protein N-terminal and lysine N-methyltransferase efm7, partial [Dimargaris xerosporica]
SPSAVELRLLGSHPLWGHILWNAAKHFTHYFDARKALVQDKAVLELGAGAALPSIVAALNGARKVVVTDYPDVDLLGNIEYNLSQSLPTQVKQGTVQLAGYIWGHDPTPLLQHVAPPGTNATNVLSMSAKFDVIILCDLIFNHSQHRNMLQSCQQCLTTDPANPGRVFVFFTHHRPHLAHCDMAFFDLARDEFGFRVEHILSDQLEPMFAQDPGDPMVRATVHGYQLTKAPLAVAPGSP